MKFLFVSALALLAGAGVVDASSYRTVYAAKGCYAWPISSTYTACWRFSNYWHWNAHSGCGAFNWSNYGGCQSRVCKAGYSGQPHSGNQNACSSCANGKYSSGEGWSSCSSCAAGKYSGGSGKSSCTTCSSHFYSGSGANYCTACPKGKKGRSNRQGCDNCPANQFAPNAGEGCAWCPSGYSTFGATGQSSCTLITKAPTTKSPTAHPTTKNPTASPTTKAPTMSALQFAESIHQTHTVGVHPTTDVVYKCIGDFGAVKCSTYSAADGWTYSGDSAPVEVVLVPTQVSNSLGTFSVDEMMVFFDNGAGQSAQYPHDCQCS